MKLAPAAIAIILNEDRSQILLVQRGDVPIWVLPGGGIETTETAQEALVREVWEETGFVVDIVRKCAEYTPVNRLAAFTTIFQCKIVGGKHTLSAESKAVAFFPLLGVTKVLLPLHMQWLQECLTHTTLIKRKLTEVSYIAVVKFLIMHPYHSLRYLWTRFSKK